LPGAVPISAASAPIGAVEAEQRREPRRASSYRKGEPPIWDVSALLALEA
jgi:hypothetical protein